MRKSEAPELAASELARLAYEADIAGSADAPAIAARAAVAYARTLGPEEAARLADEYARQGLAGHPAVKR
jgi:hypothetical protein